MAIEVFISYSHKDRALREELEIHLSNLKRQNIISAWYDGDITPGAEWEPEIMERLTSAQLILLLISADFIHSDFCYSIEMKQSIDRHNAGEARVIPIVLRPTDWQGAPVNAIMIEGHTLPGKVSLCRANRAAVSASVCLGRIGTPFDFNKRASVSMTRKATKRKTI